MFYRQIIWNMETLEITSRIPSGYSGPADKLCGATGAQKQSQANEMKVSNLLTSDFQQIFGDNENILKSITGALEPVVNAGPNQYGFNAAEDSAMRTQATDTLAAAGRNATNSVRSAVAANGGMNLPSGSEAAIEGGLAEDQANKQAEAQLAVTKAGYDTGRANFFGAEGALASAPGALENPATAAGGAAEGAATSAMQGATDIANAQNAWIAPVAGMIGDVGKAAMMPTAGCWIAEAIYGADDFRTHLVRAWLNTEFTKQRIGKIVMAFYMKFGQRIAKLVRKNIVLKTLLTPLFDCALRRAEKWKS